MKHFKKASALLLAAAMACLPLTGCSSGESVRIIRIGHNQSTNHPTHIALTAFQDYINEQLGDKYRVEVFPSELLGSQTDMVQLTQTGAIDFCVASNAILETFSKNYEIFNLPYLFASTEAYHHVMDDESITGPIFDSTQKAGFTAVTWLDAGTRNFYTVDKPINSPADLRGLKIRVQQSPTNVEMMRLLGGSATPMGFGDVYTALQSKIIDGAENNEMALTDNGHGDVCKYYSYDMHQMVPDHIVTLEEFLYLFGYRDLTFAVEIKERGVEEDTLNLIRKYGIADKCIFTSFDYPCLVRLRELDKEIRLGYLFEKLTAENLQAAADIRCFQVCPHVDALDREAVERLHRMGYSVRAWGIRDEEAMRRCLDAGVDGGMTINFPDKLTEALERSAEAVGSFG